MASARIQKWALTLSAYNYNIQYRAGKQLANADLLSRLSLSGTVTDPPLNNRLNGSLKYLTSLSNVCQNMD